MHERIFSLPLLFSRSFNFSQSLKSPTPLVSVIGIYYVDINSDCLAGKHVTCINTFNSNYYYYYYLDVLVVQYSEGTPPFIDIWLRDPVVGYTFTQYVTSLPPPPPSLPLSLSLPFSLSLCSLWIWHGVSQCLYLCLLLTPYMESLDLQIWVRVKHNRSLLLYYHLSFLRWRWTSWRDIHLVSLSPLLTHSPPHSLSRIQ